MSKTRYVQSDKLFNHPEDFQDYTDMGFDLTPIDIFGAFVPQSKNDSQNLVNAQKTIRKRFVPGD